MKCEYCGKEKEEMGFFIGASNVPDWVMNEGTGKISCPDCYKIGRTEGKAAIDAHIKSLSKGGAA